MLWITAAAAATIIHWLSHLFIFFFLLSFFCLSLPVIAHCRLIIKQELPLFMYFAIFYLFCNCRKQVLFHITFIPPFISFSLHLQERSPAILFSPPPSLFPEISANLGWLCFHLNPFTLCSMGRNNR